VVAEDGVEVVVDDAAPLVGGEGGQVGHALELLWVGGSGDDAEHAALEAQGADLGVEGARVGRGDVGQRRLLGQHALDVVQAHAELPECAHEPRPCDGLRPEEPVARLGAPGLGQHAFIRVEAEPAHGEPGARRELADRHAVHVAASTGWRVKHRLRALSQSVPAGRVRT
jgi:hypothetical protein